MTVQELILEGKKSLSVHEAKNLLASVLNYEVLDLLNHLDDLVPKKIEKEYFKRINLFKSGIPIQYIIGNVNFFGNKFKINNNVLIPRYETEDLVYNTINYIKEYFNGDEKVIDLGCGSGVIGITLKKKLPKLDVTCLDISEQALEVTLQNSKDLNVDIKIIKGDMLNNINEKYSIIISNPPYIKTNEQIEDIVRENEPSIALFAGDDGLKYYKQILSSAKKVLTKHFLIAFEIGCDQKEDIIKLVKLYFNDVKIDCLKDLSNRDRMIFIYNV